MVNHLNILISHAYDEKGLAEAWKKLIETVSSGIIQVWFSSDTGPTGGVMIGKPWLDDLYQRIAESDFILAIQTTISASRPWIMWECGVASGINRERGIIPIVYSLGRGDLSNPLTSYQAYQGDDASQVREVCERLVQKAQMTPPDYIYGEAIKTYLASVNLHRPRKPLRAEQIALWLGRIENLVQSGRKDELISLRQHMYASLGQPVSANVHETLSQLLLQQRNYEAAIEEINYALTFVPDDIQLLHRKALALVEQHNLNEAKKLLESIFSVNNALNMDTEIAALQGRIYREQWEQDKNAADLNAAFDAYYRAYQADKTSYYAGINAAELAFTKGDVVLGTQLLREVLLMCQRLQNQPPVSYWVDFSAGATYLGLNEVDKAVREYQKALSRVPAPGARERESAMKGVSRMAEARKLPTDVVDRVKAVLQ